MVTHAVMRSDTSILGETQGFKSLVIVGCPYCANFSIAYEKDEPVQKLVIDEKTGGSTKLPLAIMNESNRLKGILEGKGMSVGVEMWPPLCMKTSDSEIQMGGPQWTDHELVNRCSGAEAIVALCCAGGVIGLKERFGEDLKVIPGMKTEGISLLHFSLDKATKLVHIDRGKSTVIRNF